MSREAGAREPSVESWDWTGVEDPHNPGMDFATGWAIQNECGADLEHDPRCSFVPGWSPLSGRGLLCDCGAIRKEFERRNATPAPQEDA